MARELATEIKNSNGFKLFEPQNLALVCFRLAPFKEMNIEDLNCLNMEFLQHLNSSGKIYLSHTKVRGKVILRMSIGQTYVTKNHVDKAWGFIKEEAQKFLFSS